jgi:hypothetical protein
VITYKVARICLNGHLIGFDEGVEVTGRPGLGHYREGDRFCVRCGNKAITICPNCDMKIKGEPNVTWMAADALPPYSIPAFCYNCGEPYPWIQRRLEAAKEQIELEQSLSADDKAALKTDIEDIAHNSPRAENAAKRAKAIFQKIGSTVGSTLRDVFVNFASDVLKKILLEP